MGTRQPYSIETVADYILNNVGYPVEAMKIQKLCFYTQAWFLASRGEPFFHHDFEAWRYGPVSPSLYKYHCGRIEFPSGVLAESGKVQELTADDAQFIQKVLKVYSRYTGLQLADMCMSQPPWMETRAAYKNCRQPNKVIPVEAIICYYGSFMERKLKMSVEEKYQTIAEKIQELDDLISDSDVELQSVWDTWVTRLAGEHALYYVNDLLEVMKEECVALSEGKEWTPKGSKVL